MKQDKQELTAEAMEMVKVGSIFYIRWGWEQTNVDFFQVVSKTKKCVYVKHIDREYFPVEGAFMTGKVRPIKNEFKDYYPWNKDNNTKGKRYMLKYEFNHTFGRRELKPFFNIAKNMYAHPVGEQEFFTVTSYG